MVTPLGSHTSLTPLVTPVTVVSQGNQVAHILATPQQLGGKVRTIRDFVHDKDLALQNMMFTIPREMSIQVQSLL